MTEVKRPVQPVEVNYVCDSCNHGMMAQAGEMDSETGEVLHECVICGHQAVFRWVTYPRIDHVGIDEKVDE